MKQKVWWIFVGVMYGIALPSLLYATKNADDNFIITVAPEKKQKLSLNVIKEQVGTTTKQVFDHATTLLHHLGTLQHMLGDLQRNAVDDACQEPMIKKMMTAYASYNRVCGTIHHSLASLHRKCSSIIEKIIDNRSPFKKATRADLEVCLSVLASVQHKVASTADNIQLMCNSVKKGSCTVEHCCASLQTITKKLEVQSKMLQSIMTQLTTDTCLKVV